jgi:hypothetical protein
MRNDPGDDRSEMISKPGLEQEDEGQQDQQRAQQAAHAPVPTVRRRIIPALEG